MEENKPMYGVWLSGTGWLRGKDVFADYSLEKAKQVAYLVKGTVRFIDKSIVDLEQLYLEQERKTLWRTFKNFFQRKTG